MSSYMEKSKGTRNAKNLLERIKKSKDISAPNKKLILDFYNEKITIGIVPESLLYYLRVLMRLGETSQKNFKDLEKSDLQKFFVELMPQPHNWTGKPETDYSPRTRWMYMASCKSFYKWLFDLDDGEGYPKSVRWIKKNGNDEEMPRKMPVDILTRDEILKMIKVADNARDKAIIAILFETGMRAKELLGMKTNDIVHEENYCTFEVIGKKNKKRTVMLEWSYPFLQEWLKLLETKKHLILPHSKEFIWIAFPYSGVRRISTAVNGRLIDRDSMRAVVKAVASKAGIKKRVWNHGFRHSSATDFVKQGFNEAELRLKYGWSKKSRIPHEYTHYDFDELKKKILIRNGKLKENPKEKIEILKAKKCLYCGEDCGAGSSYCTKCGNPLNFQKPVERREERAVEILNSTLEKFKELDERGIDLKQFNRFIETWVNSNKK